MIAFVALRLAATLGLSPKEFVDTKEYFIVDLWGGVRLPIVPVLYWILHNRTLIVTVQTLAGASVWAASVHSLGGHFKTARPQIVFLVFGYTLGLTQVVAHLDTALLSESFAVTASVALLALLARAASASQGVALACVAMGTLWAATRQNNALSLLVFAVVLLAAASLRRHAPWRRIAVAMAIIGATAVVFGSVNPQIRTTNTAQVLQRRIIGPGLHTVDGGRHEGWFAARGLPPQAHELMAERERTSDFDRTAALLDDGEVRRWIEHEGSSSYVRFLATHPGYVIGVLLNDEAPRRGFVTGSTDYGHARTVLPRPVERFWWPDSPNAQTILVLAGAGCVAIIALRASRVRRYSALALFVAVALVNILVVAHTAGADYGRLLLTSAVITRLGLVWLALAAWDLTRRGTNSSA